MASINRSNSDPHRSDPIPLEDLSPDRTRHASVAVDQSTATAAAAVDTTPEHRPARHRTLIRGGSFGAEIGRRITLHRSPSRYNRLGDAARSASIRSPSEAPDLEVPEYEDITGGSPTAADFRQGFEDVIARELGSNNAGGWLSPRNLNEAATGRAPNADDESLLSPTSEVPDGGSEDDTARLADPQNQQVPAGSPAMRGRSSMQSVRFGPGTSLGDDLSAAEEGLSRSGSKREVSRSPSGARLSPSRSGSLRTSRLSVGSSPVRRVSVAVKNMSQRVVNLSNDPEAVEAAVRRRSSNRSRDTQHTDGKSERPSVPNIKIHPYDGEEDTPERPPTPLRKESRRSWHETANPLRGNSLRIFSPRSRVRLFLCDVLIHPATEPLILLLILIQTILLTVDAAPSVYNDSREKAWGTSGIDYALLVLFIIYTLEIVARCIVSGFLLNPHSDEDPGARGSFRRRIKGKVEAMLSPDKLDARVPSPTRLEEPPSLLRSLTNLNMAEGPAVPATVQSQARNRLARRAFLRHSFNRLDFVAVCSYWISLALCLSGYEAEQHLYVFRMMSCLRILRLLGITSGTSVILRSLKKAAPLLVHVAFLIGFFWLIFAVIGVQSFKGSLRRNCVWYDPAGIQEPYVQEFQFCGGHLDPETGKALPYVNVDGLPAAKGPKGYICPKYSKCVSSENPYSGTVSFDNIVQSIELVFVVMTANTFSNLMYYTADSDNLAASLFFIAGIVILAFWLANLLIAVITSSFQVIREESRKSAFSSQEDDASVQEEEVAPKKPSTLQRYYGYTHHFWLVIIAIGLLAQTFRSSDTKYEEELALNRVELAVTSLLFLEICFRFASDWHNFHNKRRNWVDFGIALITVIMQAPAVRNSGRVYDWLTIFQILRIYRVVWAIPVTRNLLSKVLGNVSGLANLLFFVILLTFLCALFAVQLVRGDIPAEYDGETTPFSFHTIYNAFLGMYCIFSSEDWTSILYMATDVQKPFHVGWISAMFFIGWFILGNFIVLNMFIAVIQENFDVTEDEKRMYQVKTFLQNKSYTAPSQGMDLGSIFRNRRTLDGHTRQAAFEMLTKQAVVESFLDEGEQQRRQSLTRAAPLQAMANLQREEEKQKRFFQRWWAKVKEMTRDRDPNPFYNFQTRSAADLAPTALAQEVVTETERRKRAQREYLAKHPNYNVSLCIFKPSNKLRQWCQRLVGPSRGSVRYDGLPPYTALSHTFSILVYCAIVSMVVLACITTPLYQKEYFDKHGLVRANWFTMVDAGFVILFTVESIIKIIADGLIWTPNAYLRGSWGVIDCVVLITLWISVGSSLRNQDEITRAVGAFKALRALRLLNISGTMQNTFHSVVIVGGRKIISAAFVSLSLIIPFAIYGVNLFAGRFDYCNDDSGTITNLTDCIHEYASQPYGWDVLAPRAVNTPYFNFDNFGKSLFILFQIVSQEGWTGVMFTGQSVTGKGLQPRPFAAEGNAVFFLAFNLLGAVFVLTLFVSVFMRSYTEQTGVAFLTSDQRTWLELRKLLRQIRPSKRPPTRPSANWKSWCYIQATNKHGWWQRSMTCIMMLHGALLLVEYFPEPDHLDQTRDVIFLCLSFCFIINIIVRIIGLSLYNFLKSRWDLYGLLTVTGTFITTLFSLAGYNQHTAFVQCQKLFLVSIVINVIPRNDQLDQLFKTAVASLSAIGNLMATWFVLFVAYAIALTQTFGLTRIGENGSGNLNFRTVQKALILLFRMTCGEAWNEIMSDFEVSEPNCVRGETFFESDCGSQGYARALFVSWNILSMYIFVSMFISLIFESFSYVYQRSGDSSAVSREELRKFKQAWSKFDPDGTGYIPKETFPRLLGHLSGIFAMRIYEEPFTVKSILEDVRADPVYLNGQRKHVPGVVEGIDLAALNRRIAQIPVHKIRRQRYMFKLFFEECLVSADKDYGVRFDSVLIILAHYKIINDNKSLRLEEYLTRRFRMQKVEEQVQRNVVTNFFLTLYWSKRFKDMKSRRTTPVSSVAQISISNVPQIFIDDASSNNSSTVLLSDGHTGTGRSRSNTGTGSEGYTDTGSGSWSESGESSAVGGPAGSFLFGGINPFAPVDESRLRQRTGRRTPPDKSPLASPSVTPSATPTMSPSGSPCLSPIRTTGEDIGWASGSLGSPSSPRQRTITSDVAPQVVLDALDSSEWREQIRNYIEQRSREGSPSRSGSQKQRDD